MFEGNYDYEFNLFKLVGDEILEIRYMDGNMHYAMNANDALIRMKEIGKEIMASFSVKSFTE
ncbi:MAG: hypothetical protein ACI837_000871 [Crocinitomicaceae bacterium]|jgi:hypothetical protein